VGEDIQQRAKVGVFGIGLEAYWEQFDALAYYYRGTNGRLSFTLPPAAFMNAWCEQGPTHHCALGVGHHGGPLRKVARLLGLEFVEIGRS